MNVRLHANRSSAQFLLIVVLLLTSGCSVLISKTGRCHDLVTNPVSRQNVHQRLGEPAQSGHLKPDTPWTGATEYELYDIRGPIYSQHDEIANKEFLGMTCGIGELYSFPAWLCERVSGLFVKYTIAFAYMPDGSIRMHDSRRGRKSAAAFSF